MQKIPSQRRGGRLEDGDKEAEGKRSGAHWCSVLGEAAKLSTVASVWGVYRPRCSGGTEADLADQDRPRLVFQSLQHLLAIVEEGVEGGSEHGSQSSACE